MKNKLRIVAALCAVVMSTSVVVPASAIPSNDVDVAETRLKIVSDRLNRSRVVNYKANGERARIELFIDRANKFFHGAKAGLLSSSDENAYATLLSLHNSIDNIFNEIDVDDLEICGWEDVKREDCKIQNTFNDIYQIPQKYQLARAKFSQIMQRMRQLSIRFAYSNANIKRLETHHLKPINHEEIAALNNEFNLSKRDFNKYLNQVKDVVSVCKYGGPDDLNRVASQLHSSIDEFHKTIDDFNSKIAQVIKSNTEVSDKVSDKVSDIDKINKRINDLKSFFAFDNATSSFPPDVDESGEASKKILEMQDYINNTEEKNLNLQHIHNTIDYATGLLEQKTLNNKHVISLIDNKLFDNYCKFIDKVYYEYYNRGGCPAIPGLTSDDFLQVFSRRVTKLKNRINFLSYQFGEIFDLRDAKKYDELCGSDFSRICSNFSRNESKKYSELESLINLLKNFLNLRFNKNQENDNKLKSCKSNLESLKESVTSAKKKYCEDFRRYMKTKKDDLEYSTLNVKPRLDSIVKKFNSMLISLKAEGGFSIDKLNECGFRSMNNKIDNIYDIINILEEDLKSIGGDANKCKDLRDRFTNLIQILDQKNPIAEQKNPVVKQENPIDEQENPIDEQKNPIVKQENPIDEQENPVKKSKTFAKKCLDKFSKIFASTKELLDVNNSKEMDQKLKEERDQILKKEMDRIEEEMDRIQKILQ